MRVVRLVISGRVQGVGFRYFVERAARRHGIAGWVRNRVDRSVEAVLAGEAAAVEAMIAECRRGPAAASVASLEVVETEGAELAARYPGEHFSVLPTR